MSATFNKLTPAAIERELRVVPEIVVRHLPGTAGRLLRAAYWRRRLGAMGERCIFGVGVSIANPEKVFLGDDVWLDDYVQIAAGLNAKPRTKRASSAADVRPGEVHLEGGNHIAAFCILQGHGGVRVGKDVGIAAHTIIYSLSNHYRFDAADDAPPRRYDDVVKFAVHTNARTAFVEGPVILEDASGIGPSCVILPGSRLGRYSWLAPATVLRGTIPSGVIAGGNPAQILKQRFNETGAE